ncbi:hypothetical protein [Streptomyces thermoalcalitolerans]|uniref:NYN domain-containing protein n=1 Tax=Streptomyces thermoalcalitolerans TaxID=65605 RepID=A0ABP3YP47_9ACTN
MNVRANENGEAASDAEPVVSILDAVVCVYFAGANLVDILLRALDFAGWQIQVPHEVCEEVKGKDAKFPGLRRRWSAVERSSRITVLPELTLISTDPDLLDRFCEIRDNDFESAHEQRQHLGECVVVAHGSYLAERGRTVYVGMDDRDGQRMAARYGLTCFTVEDVMHYAVHAGCFPDQAALKAAWDRLQRFGDGLPPFDRTGLPGTWQDYRT